MLRKALLAVNGPALGMFKWHLCLFPTVRTRDIMHYSWRSIVVVTSAPISRSVSVISSISITHGLRTLRLSYFSRLLLRHYQGNFQMAGR